MKRTFSVLLLFLLLLAPGLAPSLAHAQEKTTVGSACTTGRNVADWDTIMQCVNSLWQRGGYFLGAAKDNTGAAVTCDSTKAGMLQWTGASVQACNGTSWTALGTANSATYDSSVSLLLHMDGTNGGTTFTDSSIYQWTVAGSNATTSSTQSKFGGTSGYFNGTNGRLTITNPYTIASFGTADFTIDFWMYYAGGGTYPTVMGQYGGPTDYWYIFLNSNYLNFENRTGGTYTTITSTSTLSTNTWHHVAIVRYGSTINMYVDGTSVQSGTPASAMVSLPTTTMYIGDFDGSRPFPGYLDEVRITKGVARWTSNFTPPTEADNPADTECPYIAPGSQLFTSSGTFTPPSGITSACPLTLRALIIGGGGGAISNSSSSSANGGGGSGYVTGYSTQLTSSSSLSVAIGTGGLGTSTSTGATAGGNSSFGSATAAGGNPSTHAHSATGGSGGGCLSIDSAGGVGGTNGSYGGATSYCATVGADWGGPGAGQGTIITGTNTVQGITFSAATITAGSGGTGGTFYSSAAAGGGGGGILINGAGTGGTNGGGSYGGGAGAGYGGGGGGGHGGWSGGNGGAGAVYVEWGPSICTAAVSPSAFSYYGFTALTDQPKSTLVNSEKIKFISSTATAVSVSGQGSPQISINGGAWGTAGTISNGQTLQARMTTSASNSTTQTATVTTGGQADNWLVTTGTASGNDSYTKLLLHLENNVTDSSPSARAVTNTAMTFDSTYKEFGSYSGKFNATTSFLSIADSDDWNFGSGDFTIDGWVYPLALSGHIYILSQFATNSAYLNFEFLGTEFKLSVINNSGAVTDLTAPATLNAWQHFAIVRSGSNFYLFINGSLASMKSMSGTLPDIAAPLLIGKFNYYGTDYYFYNGYLDEIRVSKGIARWTSDFTPPTAPYN